jgi:hypothetical protein
LASEWIPRRQCENVAALADHDRRLERQRTRQLRAQLRARNSLAYDERARRADVDRIEVRQLLHERGRPERPVPADVHASQENDERHGMLRRF